MNLRAPDPERTLPTPRAGVELGHGPAGQPSLATADRSSVLALDPVGLALWELCDGETRVGEIVDAVLRLFQGRREVVLADVLALLETLRDADMLTLATE